MAQSRVLVADDDDKIRELLELYLTKEGFAVEQAADGAKAGPDCAGYHDAGAGRNGSLPASAKVFAGARNHAYGADRG